MQPYDPLNYENLARSVVNALLEKTAGPLPPLSSFSGCGVYALFYTGKLPYYTRISSSDFRTPIYVGKAISTGGRKGGPDGGLSTGTELYRRLQDHAKSVEQATNLRLEEFKCRYLVVVPVWITLAERFLIDHYRPVWNTVIDGFGNHPPGAGRKDMRRPRWDIVHPGRAWASKLKAAETPAEIIALI